MEDYRDLAIRYVKYNKRRSILTAGGVAVAVMVLYIILNLAWSYLLNYRSEIRADMDYEIVLYTKTQEQIDQIITDARVKDATVGRYYEYDYYDPIDYPNALYINTNNPYRMEKILKELTAKYNVEGKINNVLATLYLQGSTSDVGYILILIVILISYICAIFGVGIIRNSIQLTMFEHIKDFGNLRCIGSSKSQLKEIIYIQGAIVELAGIVSGICLGWIGSLIAGAFLKWDNTGFHLAPIPFIVIAFFFDLFFVMSENTKLVTKMTPVSAIRGEFRIKKEKLKRRKSGLWGRLFGVEGDYAYKNVRRNSGRFARTIAAMSLGIAASMFVFGITRSLSALITDMNNMYGYYNIYFMSDATPDYSRDEMLKSIPPTELLSQVSSLPGLSEAKRIYKNGVMVADFDDFKAHFTDDYMKRGVKGNLMESYTEHEQEIKDGGDSDIAVGLIAMNMYNISCYGYDTADMDRYKDVLVEGTTDISDNGIIIVNGGYSMFANDNDLSYVDYIDYLNYKVGDEIEFVDTEAFRQRYNDKLKPVTDEYEAHRKIQQEKYDNYGEDGLTEAQTKEKKELYDTMQDEELEYYRTKWNLRCAVYNEMIEEGRTVKYTVEGIVKKDVNMGNIAPDVSIVMPVKNFYKLTGTDESWVNGMMYHFDHFPATMYGNRISEEDEADYISSDYYEFVSIIYSFRNAIIVIGLIILFVVIISVFNIINTTASDLYLRRKELAQLRVLGISKRGLFKAVMLEGVIQTIISCIIGFAIGTGLGYGLFELIFGMIFSYHYVFPVAAAFITVIVTGAILCGAVYYPLKRMPNDVAAELMTAGE